MLKFIKRYKKVNEGWLMEGVGQMLNDPDEAKDYQIVGGESRTLEDLEAIYRADPLAGLIRLVERVEILEREVAELKAGRVE